MKSRLGPLLALIWFLAACAPVLDTSPSPEPTVMPAFTSVPTAHPTTTPASTSTVAPTATPDRPLLADGPWLLVKAAPETYGEFFLWLANPDGSGLRKLNDIPVLDGSAYALHKHEESGSWRVAYVSATEGDWQTPRDYTLYIVSVPDGEVIQSIPVGQDAILSSWGAIAWSPDGHYLAFSSLIEGDTTDLYLLDMNTGNIQRRTDHAEYIYYLAWSPDSAYLVYTTSPELDQLSYLEVTALWAIRADGGQPLLLTDSQGIPREYILDWIPPDEVIVMRSAYSGDSNIRRINLRTGQNTILYDGFARAACADGMQVCLLIEDYGEHPKLITLGDQQTLPIEIQYIQWVSSLNQFFVGDSSSIYSITVDGDIMPIEYPSDGARSMPGISHDGKWFAWDGFSLAGSVPGLWLASAFDTPVLVYSDLVRWTRWAPDSSRLYFVSELIADNGRGYQYLYFVEPPSGPPVLIVPDMVWVNGLSWLD